MRFECPSAKSGKARCLTDRLMLMLKPTTAVTSTMMLTDALSTRRQFLQTSLSVTLAATIAGCGGGKAPTSRLTLDTYVARLRSIPAGTFQMGGDSLSYLATPVHAVTLSAFRLGETPVTVGMWRDYCDATGKQMPAMPTWGWVDDHPIVGPSWVEIAGSDGSGGYCAWASARTGIALHLPTEAQWEFAARGAGQGTLYPWGDAFNVEALWCSRVEGWDAGGTAAVTRIQRNFATAQGVKDLVGNTWEWCSDWESFFTEDALSDPVGPVTGQYKHVRGGCFADNFERWFQVHTRHVMPPNYNSQTIGFRLAAPAA